MRGMQQSTYRLSARQLRLLPPRQLPLRPAPGPKLPSYQHINVSTRYRLMRGFRSLEAGQPPDM